MTSEMDSNWFERIFGGDGEMARLMCAIDWSQTPLGSVAGWPQSLKTSISIMMNSRYPMFVWWGRAYINLYNDAYRPLMGASKHPQFLGQPAKDCWADIWEVVGPLADSVLMTGRPTWSENLLLITERNGYAEEAYFTFSYSPVRDESGGVGGIFCAVTETTQQIMGERRLRSLRELSANTATAKTVEAACDLAMTTLSANVYDIPFALLYLVEAKSDQVRLAATTSSIAGSMSASPQQGALTQASEIWPFSQVQQTGKAVLVEDLEARFGDLPSGVWTEAARSALVVPLAKSGQAPQLAGFLVLGVSPRRTFDDEYRVFFDLVGSHVTTAIANAEAYAAERQRAEALTELDRAKTHFFNNISHEFRTPLTLMLNPLETVLSHPAGPLPDDREPLEMAYRNAQRLLKLVNSLLDFSRIEAGRIEAIYEPTDLSLFTTDLAGVFRSVMEQAGLQLQVDCPPLSQPIYVDRKMWEKIVLNLLSNAFKFTFTGEIAVSLRWCQGLPLEGVAQAGKVASPIVSSPHVVLEVRDTGIGIPPEAIPHLFERFHQVKGARGRSYEGSGIGLSLVQELVRLHGGTIAVSSVLGQGTRFTVSIPTGSAHLPSDRISNTPTLASTARGATPYVEEALRWLPQQDSERSALRFDLNSEPAVPLPAYNTQSVQRPRMLLADDSADMRDYVQRLLSQQYHVEVVTDGVEALAAIQQQEPDLVLADVMMPKLDGFGLLQALRRNPQTQTLPIILLSARAGEESRIEGLAAGADDYLTKPFSVRELLIRIEATLKLAQLRREAAQREQRLRLDAEAIQQRVETILTSISDGFVVLDRDWRFTYVNDRYCDIVDMKRTALLGQNVWELFPEAAESEAQQQFQRALQEQTAVQFEWLFPAWSRWFEYRVYPSPDGITVFIAEITDHKQAEAEQNRLLQILAAERAQFEAVLRQMPEGVIIADAASGNIVLANEQTSHILRYTYTLNVEPDAYEGQVPFQAYRPDGQTYAPEEYPLARSLRTGEVITHEEMELRFQDDSHMTIDVNAAPVLDDQGRITAAVVVFQNVTERKQAEVERQQLLAREQAARKTAEAAEQRARFLAEASTTLTSSLDYEYTLKSVAQTIVPTLADWCAIDILKEDGTLERLATTHVDPAKVQWGMALHRRYPPDLNAPRGLAQVLRTGQAEYYPTISDDQIVAAARDDEHLQILRDIGFSSAMLVPLSARGRTLGAISFVAAESGHSYSVDDLSLAEELARRAAIALDNARLYQEAQQARQAAERAADRTARLQVVTAALSESLTPIEVAGVIVDQSLAALEADAAMVALLSKDDTVLEIVRMVGYEASSEATQQRFSIHAPTPLSDAVRTGQPAWSEPLAERLSRYPHLAESYNRFPFEAWISLPLITEGRAVGGLSLSFNQFKQLSQDDRDFVLALTRQCAQAIVRAQLYAAEQQARAEAERANRIKDEFLAVLSHELRSPLNPILGWARLLQTRPFDEASTKRALETIERNAKLQTQLIDDLLDVSRILRGKMVLTISPVNLATVIDAALETVCLAAEAKGIEIHTRVVDGVGLILGDAGRLQQVVWNLLSNAVKFTPSGGSIHLELRQVGAHAQIQVRDTGKGITPEFLPHVFEYFRQEDGTTTRRFGGLGLGLAIVRYLTELHGGTVQAESPGEDLGATFTVLLPLPQNSDWVKPDAMGTANAGVDTFALAHLRILVVDDEADMRELTATILEQTGAEAYVVSSSKKALVALNVFKPDLLISDIGMPDMDGYELMRQVRRLAPEHGGQIPAIALTAYAGELDQQQALAAGFQRHIAKPIEPEALIQAIVALVKTP